MARKRINISVLEDLGDWNRHIQLLLLNNHKKIKSIKFSPPPTRLKSWKIWEEYYKTKKPKGFDLHHIDCNPKNNHISNLVLVPSSQHKNLHYLIKKSSK